MREQSRPPPGPAPAGTLAPAPLTIDPARTALLMRHWQNDLAHEQGRAAGPLPGRLASAGTVERTRAVLEASRRRDVVVAYVNARHRPGYPELPAKPAPLAAPMVPPP